MNLLETIRQRHREKSLQRLVEILDKHGNPTLYQEETKANIIPLGWLEIDLQTGNPQKLLTGIPLTVEHVNFTEIPAWRIIAVTPAGAETITVSQESGMILMIEPTRDNLGQIPVSPLKFSEIIKDNTGLRSF